MRSLSLKSFHAAISWAIITINTVLVVSSVYFADCFVHSSADILLEVQAQAAEENMRHGIGTCFRSRANGRAAAGSANGEGTAEAPASRSTGLPELRSMSSRQRSELEKSIHSSSHVVTSTLIRTISRQVLGKQRSQRASAFCSNGNGSGASFSKEEVEEFDAVMFGYCGKMAAAYLVLYLCSLVVLVVYGTVYLLLQGTLVGYVEVIGILMADTILFVKFTRSLYRISYINATSFPVIVGGLNAWQICLILVLARVALISMPTEFWFMGQCLMYVVAGIYLTHLSLSAIFATNVVHVASSASTNPRHSYRPPNSVVSIYTYGSSYLWTSLKQRKCCAKEENKSPEEARTLPQPQEVRSRCCCSCWTTASSRFKPTMRNIALFAFTVYMSVLTGLVANGQTSPYFPESPTITIFSDKIAQWKFGVCALLLVFNYGFAYFMVLFWRWSRENNATRARRKELGFDKVNISGSHHDKFHLPSWLERCRYIILSDYVSWLIVSALTLGLAVVTAYFVEVSLLKVSNIPIVGTVATLYPVLGESQQHPCLRTPQLTNECLCFT